MAISVNTDELSESGTLFDTSFIPAGPNVARLVSYVEMGMHSPMFNGKPDVYSSGQWVGQPKDEEFIIGLTFEFPAVEYTGDFPLCISTSIPWKNGEFLNKLSIGKALLNGKLSRQYAMRSKFLKYLEAFKAATGLNYPNMDAYVGMPFIITVTNKQGESDKDGNFRTYANMKPEGINKPAMKHPMTGKIEVFEVPEVIGEYCKVYDWEHPTMEAWKLLRSNVQEAIKNANNYQGSPTQMMLLEMGESATGVVSDKAKNVPESNNPAPAPQINPGV